MMHKKSIIWIVLKVVTVGLIVGSMVWLLWNWLIPEIFGGPKINYLQALGILALSRLLVGVGKGKMSHGYYKGNYHNLSDDEKAKLRRKFMEKCGWHKDVDEPNTGENR